MPNAAKAEVYFIVGMMVLILVLSISATYLFFRQLKKENAEKALRESAKEAQKSVRNTP